MLITPQSIPKHSALIRPPATVCRMSIATPLTSSIIKRRPSADPFVAGGATDLPLAAERNPQRAVDGGKPLHRRQRHAPEFTAWPHTCAAPLNPENPLDACGREHLDAVIGKGDVPEDPNPKRLARLIQQP